MRTLKRESVFWIMQKNKVRRRQVVSKENKSEVTPLPLYLLGTSNATPLLANNDLSPESLAFAALHIAHHEKTWTM